MRYQTALTPDNDPAGHGDPRRRRIIGAPLGPMQPASSPGAIPLVCMGALVETAVMDRLFRRPTLAIASAVAAILLYELAFGLAAMRLGFGRSELALYLGDKSSFAVLLLAALAL